MSRRNKQFWESAYMNNASFQAYYNRLTELSVSMFEWENLPDTIDPRYLELALYATGKAIFFWDEDIGYLALRTAISGEHDVYGIPKDRYAYASNGYQYPLTDENSVIIYNNFLHTNSMLDVEVFARRLYELDRAIDVNAKAQKTPIFIQCDETQRLTMKNLYMKYEGNEPFIFGDKSLDPNAIKVIRTDAPFVADRLYTLRTQIWNEALTYMGISNLNIQKRERLISDEVNRNMGGTIASRYSRLEMRRQACRQINNMFGLNIWCNYREDYRVTDKEIMYDDTTSNAADILITESDVTKAENIEGGD